MNEHRSKSRIDLMNVLEDVVSSMHLSKYRDNFILIGGFVLMTLLKETDNMYLGRMTTDIDVAFSSKEVWEEFVQTSETFMTNNSKIGATYKMVKRRGFNANAFGDSLTFLATVDDEAYRFKLDMNIKSLNGGRAYNVMGLSLVGSSVEKIICDKVAVLSTPLLCRRIKDMYDLYVISSISKTSIEEIINIWSKDNRTLGEPIFLTDMNNIGVLRHAYEKFEGITNKPEFDFLYREVLNFTINIFQSIEFGLNLEENIWNYKTKSWGRENVAIK